MSLALSFQEVEELLERIIHNRYLVQVGTPPDEQFVLLCSPKAEHILQSRFVRSRALLEAERMGLPSLDETREMADISGLVTEEDTLRVKELSEKISSQLRVLQMTKIEGRRKPIEEIIEKYEIEINELEGKKDRYYVLSRDYKSDEEAVLFLAWAGTLSMDGTQYWDSFESFEGEKGLSFRNSVVDAFAEFNRGVSTAEIRYLSRHTLWRIRYTSALKMGGPLFPGGLPDLTPDQQSLLYWSNYYQSIYEMLSDERPDDSTINDDNELDSYMESYFKRQDMERSQSRLNSRTGTGKLQASEKEEVIVTAAHPQYMSTTYSDERVKGDGSNEVEVISPHSKRAINRAVARRNR